MDEDADVENRYYNAKVAWLLIGAQGGQRGCSRA